MAKKKAADASPQQSNSSTPNSSQNQGDGFGLLKQQHKHILGLAKKLNASLSPRQKATGASAANTAPETGAGASDAAEETYLGSLRELCTAWLRHTAVEAQAVFPVLERSETDRATVYQAIVEQDLVLALLADMAARDDGDVLRAEVKVLCQMVPDIIKLEETRLLPAAKKAGVDAAELGRSIQDLSQDLAEEDQDIPYPRILRGVDHQYSKEYETMATRGQHRDRDERGRFMDEDDHREHSRRSSSSRRYEDEDNGRGWYGDSRGHSEASRRGWDERRGSGGGYGSSSRGRYEEEDDDRGYSSSRSSRGGRRTGGWFGDSEGHSEASRRGWQNPEHGESGWFGDREGHSQASRRGWDRPGHGDSGWYGDSEGHSEASRKGWRHREDDDYEPRRSRRYD